MRGTLESNWLSPTFRFFFLVGNSVSQLLTMLLYMSVSFIQFALIYGMQFHVNPLSVFLIMLVAVPSIYGAGGRPLAPAHLYHPGYAQGYAGRGWFS
jgi:ABC-2 type transport system permease protein